MNKPLKRSTCAFRQMESAGIRGFLDEAEREGIELNSLMVLIKGEVVFETWYAPYGPEIPHSMHSFTKGLTSTAIGFLVEEGRVSLEDKVISFFPERLPELVSENLRRMNIWHLLTMTCGHEQEPPRYNVGDYIRSFLNWPVPYEPGTHFYYNSMGTYMLTAILKKVTGQNLTQYLRPRLFLPLGIYDVTCDQCPMGVENGGGGVYLRTEDMAKIAQLYLMEGRWEGRQLIPSWWIKEAVSIQFKDSYDHMFSDKEDWKCGYGFFFWHCSVPGVYRFDGSFGQFGIVIPEKEAVIITTASEPMPERILSLCWNYLLPAIKPSDDEKGWKELLKKAAGLKMEWYNEIGMMPVGENEREEAVNGIRWYFPQNDDSMVPVWRRTQKPKPVYTDSEKDGIGWCELKFEGKACSLSFLESGLVNTIPLGCAESGEFSLLKSSYADFPVCAKGKWVDQNTFQADIRFLTTAHHGRYRFFFESGQEAVCYMDETPFDARLGTPKPRSYRLTCEKNL